jgi:hypothetical protein
MTLLNEVKGLDMLVLLINHMIDLWRKANSIPSHPAATESITPLA